MQYSFAREERLAIGTEGTYFPVSSGILTPSHVTAIGNAIWIFLWLIDKTTSETVVEGQSCGVVLYGKPIAARRIAADIGLAERSCRHYLHQLEAAGYIRMDRTAAGPIIHVRKSIKWRRRNERVEQSYRTGKNNRTSPLRLQPSQIDWEAEARRGL